MSQTKLQAYHNDPALKAALLKEIAQHEAADAFIQGLYSEVSTINAVQFRGCAVGCSLHSLNRVQGHPEYAANKFSDHARYPAELGIPIELAYLEDHIFESLPIAAARKWPGQFARAIRPGADLSGVMPALLQWMILDHTYGFIATTKDKGSQAVYRRFAALVARDWEDAGSVTEEEWGKIDTDLNEIPEWARWARAWARAWAWARAGAWAGANQDLATQTLKLLRAAR